MQRLLMSLLVAGLFAGAGSVGAEEGHAAPAAPKEEKKEGPTEISGTATHTQSGLAILEANNIRYRLKAGEKASDAVKASIEKIAKGELTGACKVKGVVSNGENGKQIIAVETLESEKK
jgi:hypothetical protein